MKTWKTSEPITGTAVLPGGMDQELSSLRSSFQGLDRTQLPADSFTELTFKQYAKHRIWSSGLAEQTNVTDTGVSSLSSWRAFTGANSVVGWMIAQQLTLVGHKGGNIMVNWSGNVLVSQFFALTVNSTFARNPNHIGLKIVVGGVVVAERIGPCSPHDTFQLTGTTFLPAGDPQAILYWSVTPNGPDDAFQDVTTNANLLRAHLYASKFFAIGRFR